MRLCASLLFLLLPLSVLAADGDPAVLARGRELSKLFIEQKTDAVWSQMTPTMQQALSSRDALEKFRLQLITELGEELEVMDEKTAHVDVYDVYTRYSHWSKPSLRVVMLWSLDAKGQVAGFSVRPEAASPPH